LNRFTCAHWCATMILPNARIRARNVSAVILAVIFVAAVFVGSLLNAHKPTTKCAKPSEAVEAPFQFGLKNAFRAMSWVAVMCAAWSFDIYQTLGWPTLYRLPAGMIVFGMRVLPVAGIVGALRGHSLKWMAIALLIWVVLWVPLIALALYGVAWSAF